MNEKHFPSLEAPEEDANTDGIREDGSVCPHQCDHRNLCRFCTEYPSLASAAALTRFELSAMETGIEPTEDYQEWVKRTENSTSN